MIVVPDRLVYHQSALLYITGGDNTDGLPDGTGEDELLCIALALSNHATCTVLHQVCDTLLISISLSFFQKIFKMSL